MTEQERKYYEELKANPKDWNFDNLFNINEKGEAITKEGTWFRLMGEGLPMFFPTVKKRIDLLNEVTTSTFQNKTVNSQNSSSKMTSIFDENIQPEGSIFSWENPDETPSWYDIAMNRHNESFPKKTEVVSRYDFLPIVKINNSEEPKNAIISIKECENCKREKINLGKDYDEDKQEYIVAEIIITQNSNTKIPLIVKRGYDPIGLQDEDGILKFTCNNGDVKIKLIDNDDTDYGKDEKEYDLKDAAYGDEFVLEIAPTKLKRGSKFTVTFSASDDGDGLGTTSKRIGICGKFNFTIVDVDIFLEDELKKGIDLINVIAGEHHKKPKNGEYSVNYCIQGADRFLGAIVDNKKDFYYYDDEINKLINAPSLETAKKRAEKINNIGYGRTLKEFDGSIFKFKEENEIDEFDNNPTRTLSLSNNNEIDFFFKQQIGNRIGIHIFYLSIVDAFHTLFIVIKNIEPCEATYEIYDEDGLSRSYGDLKDISKGIGFQSQWVYRWAKDRYGYWAKLNVLLLKFQRKQ